MSPQQKRKLFTGAGLVAPLGLLLLIAQSCIYGERLECPGIVCPVNMACSPNGAPVCIPQGCGDGELVTGEECDAGGVETADCNINCKRPKCGDGVVNQLTGEQCDRFGEPNAECNLDCTDSKCGDGKINPAAGEECDDEGESEKCNADCTKFGYGDGKVNSAAGEACDDGNLVDGDGCNSKGELESCGNNVIDIYEQCDEGGVDTKTCNYDCTEAKCGDKKVNETAGEKCDDGPSGSETCNSDCSKRQCGDGIINEAAGEECDPGAPDKDIATCTRECKKSFCGDEYTNEAAGEKCDAGENNTESCPYGRKECDVCTARCQKETLTGTYCGDNIVQTEHGEVFDDGNAITETQANCKIYKGKCHFSNFDCTKKLDFDGPYCGDGVTDSPENCDYKQYPDNCTEDCKWIKQELCGNGKYDPGEACDDGNRTTEAACPYGQQTCIKCKADCSAELHLIGPYCGDKKINGPEGQEQCEMLGIPEICNMVNCSCTPPHVETNQSLKTLSAYSATNEIVIDTISGLVWQREADNVHRIWQEAKNYCSSLKLADCGGWRLPTLSELGSLVDVTRSSYPYINVNAFPGTIDGYWTSTEDEENALLMCVVDFGYGLIDSSGKFYRNYVRCVR
jgi:cysteine-rich repeat protein